MVLIERLATEDERISSSTQYQQVFNSPLYTPADKAQGVKPPDPTNIWYASGRDLAMEAELANMIKQRLGPG
jgi:hypothetical protein